MFKIGDNVGVLIRDEREFGVVCDVCTELGSVSIAIGKERIYTARACDVFYDEGYKKLKQEKFT